MVSYLLFLPLVAVAVVVAAVFVLNRRGGKELKCPDCGEVFKAPAMDEKLGGMGWTLPYTGRVACPKCKGRRSRRDYETVARKGQQSHSAP